MCTWNPLKIASLVFNILFFFNILNPESMLELNILKLYEMKARALKYSFLRLYCDGTQQQLYWAIIYTP